MYLKSEKRSIFENVNFELECGKNLIICGESGSGKSTLAKIIAMLESPSYGEVFFEENSILGLNFESQRKLRQKISYVFQEQKLALNPQRKIKDLLCVCENFGFASDFKKADEMFGAFELDTAIMERKAREISTGQAQRVGLIRSMLLNPKVLILDELTAPLDLSIAKKILRFLARWQGQNAISYIFITHTPQLFGEFDGEMLVMGD
ncbi:ATP-binding cassette domain-containing protein [Helicobacter sp. 23-1044]